MDDRIKVRMQILDANMRASLQERTCAGNIMILIPVMKFKVRWAKTMEKNLCTLQLNSDITKMVCTDFVVKHVSPYTSDKQVIFRS